MTISFVDSSLDASFAPSGTTYNATYVGTLVAGNAIAFRVGWIGGTSTITSVTDSLGNTYYDCGAGRCVSPTGTYEQLFGAKITTGGVNPTITVNFTGSQTETASDGYQYVTAATGNIWDSVFGADSSGGALAASVTPTVSDGAFIAMVATNGTTTTDPTFTDRVNLIGVYIGADCIFTSSPGTKNVSFTGASSSGVMIVGVMRAADGTTYNKSIAGTITPAGALTKQTRKSPAGSITPAGALTKRTGKLLAGTITPAGALTRAVVKLISLAGTITPAGAIAKQTGKLLAGALTPAGTLTRMTSKLLAGTLSPAGALLKRTTHALAGTVSFSATLAATSVFLKSLAGGLSFAGSLATLYIPYTPSIAGAFLWPVNPAVTGRLMGRG